MCLFYFRKKCEYYIFICYGIQCISNVIQTYFRRKQNLTVIWVMVLTISIEANRIFIIATFIRRCHHLTTKLGKTIKNIQNFEYVQMFIVLCCSHHQDKLIYFVTLEIRQNLWNTLEYYSFMTKYYFVSSFFNSS